jgi:hypothetical protein
MSVQAKAAIAALALFLASAPCFAECYARNTCSGGTPVECYGQSICEVLSNGVRCDGVFTGCSGGGGHCHVDYACPSPPFSSRWFIQCSSSSYCSVDPDEHSITCGWQTITCQECEDAYLNNYGWLCWQLP